MKTILIALIAGILGAAIGWTLALQTERGSTPVDADEMYARMSAVLDNRDDMLQRAHVLTHLSMHVNSENVEGAVRAFSETSVAPLLTAFDAQVFFAAWARLEGEAILEKVKSWGANRFNRLALAAVLSEYGRQGEIDRARDLFFSMPSSMHEQAVAALFVPWAEYGQYSHVEEVVLSFPKGNARDTAMQILAGQIVMRQGKEAMIEWVESLKAPGKEMFKHLAFEWAVRALTRQSPDEAREWVEARWVEREGWSRRGPEFLVKEWSRSDPHAAIEWVVSLEAEDDVMRRVIQRAASDGLDRWVLADAVQAGVWLIARDIEPWHDRHSEKLARHFTRRAPRQAIVFSNRIQDEMLRKRTEKLLHREFERLPNRDELFAMIGEDGPKILTHADMTSEGRGSEGSEKPRN